MNTYTGLIPHSEHHKMLPYTYPIGTARAYILLTRYIEANFRLTNVQVNAEYVSQALQDGAYIVSDLPEYALTLGLHELIQTKGNIFWPAWSEVRNAALPHIVHLPSDEEMKKEIAVIEDFPAIEPEETKGQPESQPDEISHDWMDGLDPKTVETVEVLRKHGGPFAVLAERKLEEAHRKHREAHTSREKE